LHWTSTFLRGVSATIDKRPLAASPHHARDIVNNCARLAFRLSTHLVGHVRPGRQADHVAMKAFLRETHMLPRNIADVRFLSKPRWTKHVLQYLIR